MSEERKVHAFIDPEQMSRDTTISTADLDVAMVEQSGLFAYYAALHAKAMQQEGLMKTRRDVTESKVDKELRDVAADEGRKITEAQLTKDVARDPRVIRAHLNLNEARAQAQLAAHALEALKHRRDMLVQLGVSAREERKGDLFVRQKEAEEARSKSLRERALEMAAGK